MYQRPASLEVRQTTTVKKRDTDTMSKNNMPGDNERLDDLEIKFSYQQETIDALNETVTKQWDLIERLRRQLERLEGQLIEMADGQGGDEPPPPHY